MKNKRITNMRKERGISTMEEDIKILEEYLDKQDRKFVSEYRLMILQAIENLIARNKELEVKLKLSKELYYDACKCLLDTIDKSKVREKIEEEKDGIKRDLKNIKKIKDEGWKKAIEQSINIRNRKIELCEELLQEGDK